MIKHVLKIIWAQRKSNGWIFAELVVVIAVLWCLVDKFYVDLRTYCSPLGYDIADTWRFSLNKLNPLSPNYVPETEYTSSQAADLLQLMAQIRQHPLVEEVCMAFYSCPYSFGNSWSEIRPVEGDTTQSSQQNFQVRRVSPEYFDVFRVKNPEGKQISARIFDGIEKPMVITQDMSEAFFHERYAKGRKVSSNDEMETWTILEVTTPIRGSDYVKSNPCFFTVLSGSTFESFVNSFGAETAELCVRMKRTLAQEEMYSLLEEMGGRLTVNNLSVYGAQPVAAFREILLSGREENKRKEFALTVFLLVNVFFGIIGTFWLRTQHRKGEAGLRMALGASRRTLKAFLYGEGLSLLLLTLPFTLAIAVNLFYLDIPDSYRLPFTVARFLLTFGGTYLLLGLMICLGVWFPVRKTARLTPAEALHYE